MLSKVFHPKLSRACSPLPMGMEWPVADGPMDQEGPQKGTFSQLLSLQLLRSTGCCDPARVPAVPAPLIFH